MTKIDTASHLQFPSLRLFPLAVFLRITFPIFQPRLKCLNIFFARIELANDREQCRSQTFERPQVRFDFIEVVILHICDCAILVKMDDANG